MSKAECGVIGLCPLLTEDSEIVDCDECEKIEAYLREKEPWMFEWKDGDGE